MLRRGALAKLQQLVDGTLGATLVIVADGMPLPDQFEGNVDPEVTSLAIISWMRSWINAER